jgi:hypothetical protein
MLTAEEAQMYIEDFDGLWLCVVPDNYHHNTADMDAMRAICSDLFEISFTFVTGSVYLRRTLFSWFSIYRLVKEGKFEGRPSLFNLHLEPKIITFDEYIHLMSEFTEYMLDKLLSEETPYFEAKQVIVSASERMTSYVADGRIPEDEFRDTIRFLGPDRIQTPHDIVLLGLINDLSFSLTITPEIRIWLNDNGYEPLVKMYMTRIIAALYECGYEHTGIGGFFICIHQRLAAFARHELVRATILPVDIPLTVMVMYRRLVNFGEVLNMFAGIVRSLRTRRLGTDLPISIRLLPFAWFVDELERDYLIRHN